MNIPNRFALLVSLVAAGLQVPARSAETLPPGIRLPRYLEQLGQKVNCYFTVETIETGTVSNALRLSDHSSPNTVDAVVKDLRRQIPGAEVWKEKIKGQETVIHIVDRALKRVPHYALTERVSLSFRGDKNGLANSLGDALGGRLRAEEHYFGALLYDDDLGPFPVDVTHQRVRQILTEYYFKGARIRWGAITRLRDGVWRTGIHVTCFGEF